MQLINQVQHWIWSLLSLCLFYKTVWIHYRTHFLQYLDWSGEDWGPDWEKTQVLHVLERLKAAGSDKAKVEAIFKDDYWPEKRSFKDHVALQVWDTSSNPQSTIHTGPRYSKIGKVWILASNLAPGKGNHHCLFAYFLSPGHPWGPKWPQDPFQELLGPPETKFLMILDYCLLEINSFFHWTQLVIYKKIPS